MNSAIRSRVTPALLMHASKRLTDRDRLICSLLADHRVLTTDNILDIGFDSAVTTRHRMTRLYEARVVDRFRPFRNGRITPYHYVLDEIGAHVIAADRGMDLKTFGWNRMKTIGLESSLKLDHLVEVNSFFTGLYRAARGAVDRDLVTWWSERRCGAEWGDFVIPDGFGIWRQGDAELQFFLEHDRGTENLERVASKLDRYEALERATGSKVVVLFRFPGNRRESGFISAVGNSRVSFATSVTGNNPAEAVWLSGRAQWRTDLRGLTEVVVGHSGSAGFINGHGAW